MSARVAATAALAGLPLATLVAAYAWLAHDHATSWVFPVVVHEGGRYTLTGTPLLAALSARGCRSPRPMRRPRWRRLRRTARGRRRRLRARCDARYLGHQAREAATHLLVTLPLSFTVLAVAGAWGAGAGIRADGGAGRDASRATAAAAVTIAYLTLGVLATDARSGAAAAPLSSLVAAHSFEHGLDYVLVGLLVLAFAPRAPRALDLS